jgi:hypothetical protein
MSSPGSRPPSGQFALLSQRRFAPFFLTLIRRTKDLEVAVMAVAAVGLLTGSVG